MSILLLYVLVLIVLSTTTSRPITSSSIFDKISYEEQQLIDFVITITINDISCEFLEKWKPIIQKYHCIIVLEANININDVKIPNWIDYELYTNDDMKRDLDKHDRIIGSNGYSLRNFGMWVSDRDYLYNIDSNCIPCDSGSSSSDSSSSSSSNSSNSNIDNFFDDLKRLEYVPRDLLKDNRSAFSFGTVSYINDDGSISRPLYYDDTTTNMIISRKLNGFMVYYHDYKNQYSDELSDFFLRKYMSIVLDYSYLNTLRGKFCVVCKKRKAPLDTALSLIKIKKDELLGYINDIPSLLQFRGSDYNTVVVAPWRVCEGHFFVFAYEVYHTKIECSMLQFSRMIGKKFDHLDHTIVSNVSFGIGDWLVLYNNRHARGLTIYGHKELAPNASKSSIGPSSPDSTCAVFTIVKNEYLLLPLWLRNMKRYIPEQDIFIFDHHTEDGSTDPSKVPLLKGVNIIKLDNNDTMPVHYRSHVVFLYQDRFMRSGYKCTLFSDTDELIFANPVSYPGGLTDYLRKFGNDPSRLYHRVVSWDLGHMNWGNGTTISQETAFNYSNPYIFQQRRYYHQDPKGKYNKPLLSKKPMLYRPGFHHPALKDLIIKPDPDLLMLHMQSFDWDFCQDRNLKHYEFFKRMIKNEAGGGFADHWGQYEKMKKNGELCRLSNCGFFGVLTNTTSVYDGKGVLKMERVDDIFMNVMI